MTVYFLEFVSLPLQLFMKYFDIAGYTPAEMPLVEFLAMTVFAVGLVVGVFRLVWKIALDG